MNVESLFILSLLLILSVFASKISDRFGIPALLLFLVLGMVAGSEGIGGIYFDDPGIAQTISITALVLILFSGGLQTKWSQVRPVMYESISLATIGVLLTAITVGFFAWQVLGLTLIEGLLLGSMMSSTDAAAVFSVLRSKGISLKGNLKPLLELESGSNDPMAVFLTIGLIQMINLPNQTITQLIVLFIQQMLVGLIIGYLMGRLAAYLINRLELGYEGLYPVFSLGFVILTFGVTTFLNGSGFLAVYLMGIVMNKVDVVHKRTLQRFHDGFAWLMQIAMFLVLGLFVFPSQLIPIAGLSLFISLVLIFIARPLGVLVTLMPRALSYKEKIFISWVGLRGAAPIILATFPMLAGIEQSSLFFNVIFFVVLTSVLIQGTTIPLVASWLQLDKPIPNQVTYPIEYQPVAGMDSEMVKIIIPTDSLIVDEPIVDLHLPDNLLIILIERDNQFIVPYGATKLKANDTLLVITDQDSLKSVENRFKLFKQEF